MVNKEEVVAFLNDMVDALTWKRFWLLTLLGTVMIALLLVFDNRTTIFNSVFGGKSVKEIDVPWQVTQQTKTELITLTKQENIAGVMLTEVNLKKNRRIVKFWHTRDPEFKKEVDAILATLLPQAFFDTDKQNNEQMLKVLQNEFTCSPMKQTIYGRFEVMSKHKVDTVCRLSVPPYVGEFAGMISLLMKKPPTPAEIEALKIELSRVSIELYLRDIRNAGK